VYTNFTTVASENGEIVMEPSLKSM
jgi:hypothetical protein